MPETTLTDTTKERLTVAYFKEQRDVLELQRREAERAYQNNTRALARQLAGQLRATRLELGQSAKWAANLLARRSDQLTVEQYMELEDGTDVGNDQAFYRMLALLAAMQPTDGAR